MKCPKCGYNSFEIQDTCKKCANDLTGFKNTHGLKPVVLPMETRTEMAEKLMAQSALDVHETVADVPTDMFSFDIPAQETAVSGNAFTQDDPFDFGDQPASPALGGGEFSFSEEQKSAQAKAEEEAFADLLESSPQAPQAAAAFPAAVVENTGEDLSNFSWDDTPDAVPSNGTKATDDFDSLFGDTDEVAKK